MEMQKIITEGESIEDEATSERMSEAKTQALEEEEPEPYSKLEVPTEDVYSEAYYGGTLLKKDEGKQTARNICLYRAACVVLTIICLILLLVVGILSVKLQTGSTACPERERAAATDNKNPSFASACSYEQCQAHFPDTQLTSRSCQQCADGWLTFGRSCFFLSTFRLSWDESQRNCSARGGSLAVINSLSLQRFLTDEGKLKYWIGLRQNSDIWTWIDKTALRESYWAGAGSEGDCGILSSEKPSEKNWITASCQAYTYFICQLQM